MTATLSILSFTAVSDDGETVDRWSPAPSLTWDSGCRAGRLYASEAVTYMGATGDLNLIPAIMRKIVERREIGAVETGFFTALAEHAVTAASREGKS